MLQCDNYQFMTSHYIVKEGFIITFQYIAIMIAVNFVNDCTALEGEAISVREEGLKRSMKMLCSSFSMANKFNVNFDKIDFI